MKKFLVSLAIASLMLVPASSVVATNADNETPLSFCKLANGFAGGIELFNLETFEGGSRVWCVSVQDTDEHFGGFPSGMADSFVGDIGSFNDKADSARVRVNPQCEIEFLWWTQANTPQTADGLFRQFNPLETTSVNYGVNLPNNILSSGELRNLKPSCMN